jgi:streptogramin lyase
VPFASKLTPSGGNGTYTFAIGSGSLPTGVTLGPDGTVSGTPRTAGAYRATVKVTDSEGRTLDYAANFGIAARLKVGTLLLKPGKVGKLYRSKLAATGGIAPRKWKVTVGPLPKGIRLDRTTGILSGTPTKEGRYRVSFQVTDGLKVVASKRLRIDVLP